MREPTPPRGRDEGGCPLRVLIPRRFLPKLNLYYLWRLLLREGKEKKYIYKKSLYITNSWREIETGPVYPSGEMKRAKNR